MSRRIPRLLGCALVALSLGPVAADAAAARAKAKPDVTIMSRNLYLGADIIKLVSATDVAGEQQQVQALHQVVNQTNFPLRAQALAAEVAATKPDVIGLQEVARYYRTPDGAAAGTPATQPLYDWMTLLQAELAKRRQSYRVVVEQTEIDITVPSAEGLRLRLKLGNAVLVRTGKGARVSAVRPLSGQFAHQLQVALPDQSVALHRGYAGLDGVVGGRRFRFLDPHAEAYSAAAANGQFQELLAGPARSRTRPTIIAGDFNSDPADPGADNAYDTVAGAGFTDTGQRAATCCQNETVNNPVSELKTWIDHIVVRPKATVLSTTIVGDTTSDVIGGLWPSDHAGVVATIRLKRGPSR
jgi:endonuclease/exonuclease/phosphatase family metal-dependent hydrolase